MYLNFIAFVLFIFTGIQGYTQIAVSSTFEDNLTLMDILWSHPSDAGFKTRSRDKGRLQKADHILYSKKEGLEIRVFLYPEQASTSIITFCNSARMSLKLKIRTCLNITKASFRHTPGYRH